jgi:hypothetical protein
MLLPIDQTQPAKFISAHASHIHAPRILLNRIPALGTIFGVGQQPLFAVISHNFLIPLRKQLASQWPVTFIPTGKAP